MSFKSQKVITLKRKKPNLTIELNGGLNTPLDCIQALNIFDGAMVGRAAYSHPLLWQSMDELIFGDNKNNQSIPMTAPVTTYTNDNNTSMSA